MITGFRPIIFQSSNADGFFNNFYLCIERASYNNYSGFVCDKISSRRIFWYDNGQFEYYAEYENNIKHGVELSWYENGIRKRRTQFNNGIVISTQYWNENGIISVDTNSDIDDDLIDDSIDDSIDDDSIDDNYETDEDC